MSDNGIGNIFRLDHYGSTLCQFGFHRDEERCAHPGGMDGSSKDAGGFVGMPKLLVKTYSKVSFMGPGFPRV